MFQLIKYIFGITNSEDANNQVTEPESRPIVDTHAKPVCSFCKGGEHNITKCPEATNLITKIKTYCSEYANQQNIPATMKWLDQFDKKILDRYVTVSNINNYMWYHCSVYWTNNIEGLNGKNKLIQLIIGHDCVLPLHPEIRIKRVRKESKTIYVYTKEKPDYSPASAFGAGLIMGTGIAAGAELIS
jgi:hypothetical protein